MLFRSRAGLELLGHLCGAEGLERVFKEIQREYQDEVYHLEHLLAKFRTFDKEGMTGPERFEMLIKAAVELTTQEAPKWEFIAARFLMVQYEDQVKVQENIFGIRDFYSKVVWLTEEKLYGEYVLENYTREELDLYETYLDEARSSLLNYSGLGLLLKRYVIRSHEGIGLETVQEMFLGIAMHLAMKEERDRDLWVKRF